jgi:hypothetical protein
MVLGALSAFAVILGTVAASRAPAFPKHQGRIEFWSGVLLVSGFAMLAVAVWSMSGWR